MLHSRSASASRLVRELRSKDRGPAVHRVYWIPLYDILEERGFEVYLVNARHTKNLPGRKSDVQESQWLLKLHTLRAVEQFIPTTFGDSGTAHLLAAADTTREWSGDLRSTNAESTDPDEHTEGQTKQE